MDALSLIGRGFMGYPNDHGYHRDVLAASREDGCLPLALLDLIIHTVCMGPCPLSVEVLRATASIVAVYIGLICFSCPGSF